MIKFKCPKCAQSISAGNKQSGVEFECPSCSETGIVPEKKSYLLSVLTLMLLVTTCLFAVLYIVEKDKKQKFKIKEVVKTVDRVVEIPKEVIKRVEVPKEVEVIKRVEVPREKTKVEEDAMLLYNAWVKSENISSDDTLKGVESFSVRVDVNNTVGRIVTKKRLKNKIELFLRNNGVKIDDNSSRIISFTAQGIWNEQRTVMTLSYSVAFLDSVYSIRKGKLVRPQAVLWRDRSFGYAGKNVIEDSIIDTMQEKRESFANTWRSKNP